MREPDRFSSGSRPAQPGFRVEPARASQGARDTGTFDGAGRPVDATNGWLMVSAAGASVVLPFLPFLPMLPGQILLNNLLYDTSQLAIPTDQVDPEEVGGPRRWDIAFVRRFMLVFGPVSSVFDFLTFAVMLGVFHAGPALFRSGWFVESMARQCLVVFCIRTRRVPFVRSRPSRALLLSPEPACGVAPRTPAGLSIGSTGGCR